MQQSSKWWVWLADMGVLLVFAAIGRQSHAEHNPISAIIMTAAPFALAWSVIGYATGVLVPQPRRQWLLRSLGANVLACGAALVMRMYWLQRDSIPWTFAVVAFAVTTIFLLIIRILYRRTEEHV